MVLRLSLIHIYAYQFVLKESRIWSGYANTIFYTVFGTVFGTAVVLMAAFALSRKELWGRNVIMKLMVFTMFFSGGLIPTYMVAVSYTHLGKGRENQVYPGEDGQDLL